MHNTTIYENKQNTNIANIKVPKFQNSKYQSALHNKANIKVPISHWMFLHPHHHGYCPSTICYSIHRIRNKLTAISHMCA